MKHRLILIAFILSFFFTSEGYTKNTSFTDMLHEMDHAGLTIRHHQQGASDKTIVLIEDAHTNYPAQKELANIIEQLLHITDVQLVAVEGSQGEILTHFFASFPIEETRKNLADNLLKNGLISGEEYLSISRGVPLRIVGVDDRALYKQNIARFRDFYQTRPKAHPVISRIQNGLFKAKVTTYDSVLFKFDTTYLSYEDGSVDLTNFLAVCEHLIPTADKLFFDFPALNDVRIIVQEQDTFDFDTLYSQATQLAKMLIQDDKPAQADSARNALLKNMAGKTAHRTFYRSLMELAEKSDAIDLSSFDQLKRYVELTYELDQVDPITLQKEIDGFVAQCYRLLLTTDEETTLYTLSSTFETLNQLYSLSLVRTDYLSLEQSTQISVFIQSFITGYNALMQTSPISPEDTAFLTKILLNNVEFYHTATQRDTAILDNTLAAMEQEHCTTTILIAGGFHKDHIIASCAAQQIGCIVISPAVAGDQDFDHYASVVLRNDRLTPSPQPNTIQGNYLRASSFFAQSSFDSIQHITTFRNNFIFEAMLDSLDTIDAGEIHTIIKAWRTGFITALTQHHAEDSPTYRNALSIFDYLVTDVFAAGNTEIHPETGTILLFSMGQTLKISRSEDTGVSVEPIADYYLSNELEKSFALINSPLVLRNSQVFIAGWVITDDTSPYRGHGDAHYAVKFIEALNQRGIVPTIILPYDTTQRQATINKYLTAISPEAHQFRFVTYNEADGSGYSSVGLDGRTLASYSLSPGRRPIVLDLASSIDPARDQRIATIKQHITQAYGTLLTTQQAADPTYITAAPDMLVDDIMESIDQTGLRNNPVFVSAWSLNQDGDPVINLASLPKITRIIEQLNQRGIVPMIPIPYFSPLDNRTRREFIQHFTQYLTSIHNVQFVAFNNFDSYDFTVLGDNGFPLTSKMLSSRLPALVIHLASSSQTDNTARLEEIDDHIRTAQSDLTPITNFQPPVFIRIPTAGTTVTPIDGVDILNIHMASTPGESEGATSLKTGFMADAELLNLIGEIRSVGKPLFRKNIIRQLNEQFEQRIESALAAHPNFSIDQLDWYPWTFRYLTEKSDAELAAFMKAAVRADGQQVLFTFYGDTSEVDIRHKTFLKKHFAFLDLQQSNNDSLQTDSSVLVINVPPLSSTVFKALMASADTATVSGENSLLETLALNKFGVGPLPIFRPAIAEHWDILSVPLTVQNHPAMLEQINRYTQLDDASSPDALSTWDAADTPSIEEQGLLAILSDPETQLYWRSALADIAAPVNGLNTLTNIIGEIDRSTPVADIISTYNQALQSDAYALTDAFIDGPLDHISADGQQQFIDTAVTEFVTSIVINGAKRRIDAAAIRPLINSAARHIVSRYNHNLRELAPISALQHTQQLEQKLYTALAGIDIVGNGHLFIPIIRNGQHFFSYTHIDFNSFHPDKNLRDKPVVRQSTIVPSVKKRIAQDINDTQYVREFLSFLNVSDALDAQYLRELPHTFTASTGQIELSDQYIAHTALPLFRQIARENADILTERYGSASIAALYTYYFDYRTSISLSDPGDNAFIDRIIMAATAMFESPYADSTTFFFRGSDTGDWTNQLEHNLQTLIAQKTALNDFTLSARSIGASIGKEAYTQAAIIEHALKQFAYTTLFTDTAMDQQQRDQSVQEWIESWDVRIYAFERSFQRSITIQTGVYQLSPDQIFFFESPEGQNYISLFENNRFIPDPTDEHQAQGVIAHRFKNWVIPVFSGDLSENPAILSQYPAEITFMMNMLTYFSSDQARTNLYRSAMDSSSSRYRSFVMYNESFDEPPTNHFILDELPYTIPPLAMPFLSHIAAAAQIAASTDKATLSRTLGVYSHNRDHSYSFEDQQVEVQIAGTETRIIETGQFYAPDMLSGIVDDAIVDFYLQLENLISALTVTPDSPAQTIAAQQQFTAEQLPEFLQQFILFMIDKDLDEDTMRAHLADAQQVTATLYTRALQDTPQEFAAQIRTAWNDTLQPVFDGLEITEEFDIFIPLGSDQLLYLKHGIPVFNKGDPDDDSVTVKTRVIPVHTKSQVIQAADDTAVIGEILQQFDFDNRFNLDQFPSLSLSWSKTPALYQANYSHNLFILNQVAASLAPSFNSLLQKHTDFLTAQYGSANLETLRQFIDENFVQTSLLSDPSIIGSLPPELAQRVRLANDIQAIINQLYDDREEDGQPSVTGFFRPASKWDEFTTTVTAYFDDLILQKIARGDYTITLRDIGASTGKEALSIAALLESSLLSYATTTLFADIDSDSARNRAVQQWINRWDVHILAFEQFPARLVPLSIGQYDILHRKEVEFFVENPEYFTLLFENGADRLEEIQTLEQSFGASPDDLLQPAAITLRVRDRLSNWIIPVASDIRDLPELAFDTPAEATFFLNTFYQLGYDESILQQLENSSSPQYKSLFLFNRNVGNNPESLGQIDGQEYVIPAQTQPSLADIEAFISAHQIYSPAELNRIFGVTPAQLPAFNAAESLTVKLIETYPVSDTLPAFKQNTVDNLLHDALVPLIVDLLRNNETPASIQSHLAQFRYAIARNYFVFLTQSGANNIPAVLDAVSQHLDRYIAGITITESADAFLPVPLLGQQGFDHIYLENQQFKQFLEDRTDEFFLEQFDFQWDASNRISSTEPVVRSSRLTAQAKSELIATLRDRRYARRLLDGLDFNTLFRYHISDSIPRNFVKGEFLKPDFDIPAFSFEDTPETASAIKDHLSEILLDHFRQLAKKHAPLLRNSYNTADVRTLSLVVAQLQGKSNLTPAQTALMTDYTNTARLLQDPYENGAGRKKQSRFFSGKTRLFRKFEAWYKQYDNYLYDVIAQKVAAGDLTFRIASIGSSIGKEPYSLASLFERKLIQYARQNLFRDNPDDPRIQEWVDSWDVKVFAYDHSLQRLATSREGFYALDGKMYNHRDSDLDFFEQHPAFLDMFSVMHYPEGHRNAAKAQTTARLQRWVQHRFLDLQGDLAALQDTPANAVFFMNVYPNLSEVARDDVLSVITQSLQSSYKSFLSYNTEIIGDPVEHGQVTTQPLVLAAYTPPPLTLIDTISHAHPTASSDWLNRYFGLQTPNGSAHPQIQFYNRFTSIIQAVHGRDAPDAQHFTRFIEADLPTLLTDYIAYHLERNPSLASTDVSHIIDDALLLVDTHYARYGSQHFSRSAADLSTQLGQRLEQLSNKILTPVQGHVLIPAMVQGTVQNHHIFIESQPFHIDPAQQNTPVIHTEDLNPGETYRLTSRLANLRHIRAILDTANIEIELDRHIAEKRALPTFNQNPNAIKDLLAEVLFDRFSQLVKQHTDELAQHSYAPTFEGLAAFYSLAVTTAPAQNESPLFMELNAIIESINTQGENGISWLFRHGKEASETTLKFLNNLIAQKATRADNTITLRSLGSSTGEEAYAMASMVERALTDYAEQHLFPDNPQAVQDWIDHWTINIYAIDSMPLRHVTALNGMYLLSKQRVRVLHDIIDPLKLSIGTFTPVPDGSERMMVTVPARFKKWVKPVVADFGADPAILQQYQGEVTYLNNILNYVPVDDVIDAVLDSSNQRYMSFLASDVALSEHRPSLTPFVRKFPGSRGYILPPKELPAILNIIVFAEMLDEWDEDDLFEMFGLDETHREFLDAIFEIHDTVLQKFNTMTGQDEAFAEELLQSFAQNDFPLLQRDLTHSLLAHQELSDELNRHLLYLTMYVNGMFRNALDNAATPNAQRLHNEFIALINAYTASIEITADSQVFLPVQRGGTTFYSHNFVDYRPFHPREEVRNNPVVTSNVISEDKKNRIIEETRNIKLILPLLENDINFTALLDRINEMSQQLERDRIGVFPFYSGDPLQIQSIKQSIAQIAIYDFAQLQETHRELLMQNFDDSSFASLAKLLTRLNSDASYLDRPPYRRLMNDYLAIIDRIQTIDTFGYSEFFRRSHDWLSELETFLDDLIVQKAAVGDFTITAKSIGASYGKEIISLGGVIEKSLIRYAHKNLFAADEPVQSDQMQAWLDQWDVTLQAYDMSYWRMAAMMQGVFLETIVGYETGGYEFLRGQGTEYANIFSTMHPHDPLVGANRYGEQTLLPTFAGVINPRIMSWIQPVPVNLQKEPEAITVNPAEIMFSMNVMWYFAQGSVEKSNPIPVDASQRLIQNIHASANPRYKTFAAYNGRINSAPEEQHAVSGQKYVLPPAVYPGADTLSQIITGSNLRQAKEISRLMGFSLDQERVFTTLYRTYAGFMISYFDEERIRTSLPGDTSSLARIRRFLTRAVLTLSQLDVPVETLEQHLSILSQLLTREFSLKLDTLVESGRLTADAAQAQREAFTDIMESIVDSMDILPGSNLFLPAQTAGFAEYFFIDTHAFSVNKAKRGMPEISSRLIPDAVAQTAVNDTQDIPAVIRILTHITGDFLVLYPAKDMPPGYDAVNSYPNGQHQQYLIRLGQTYLSELRQLVTLYADELTDSYGAANLTTLYQLIVDRMELREESQLEHPILGDIAIISASLTSPDQEDQADADAPSGFFQHGNWWIDDMSGFISDVIAQKIVRNDRSFTVRSVGSTTGEEAYSIAAVIEKSLRTYAQENLFADSPASTQSQQVEEWIDSWNIQIHLYDSHPYRLASALEGVFELEPLDMEWIEQLMPEFNEIIEERAKLDNQKTRFRIKTRLRAWMRPHHTNLNRQTPLEPAEITVAMNSIMFLDQTRRDSLIAELTQTQNPQYKSYFLYNTRLQMAPELIDQISGQPFTLPALNEPDAGTIDAFIQDTGITEYEALTRIFGLTQYQKNTLSAYKRMLSLAEEFLVLLNEQIGDVIQPESFVSADQLLTDIKTELNQFMGLMGPEFFPEVIADFLKQGKSPAEIHDNLRIFSQLLSHRFSNQLLATQHPAAKQVAAHFETDLSLFISSIMIENGEYFIPDVSGDETVVLHYTVDWRAFHPEDSFRGKPQTVLIDTLTTQQAMDALAQLADITAANKILTYNGFIDFSAVFDSWNTPPEGDEARNRVGFVPFYSSSIKEIKTLQNSVAALALDELNSIAADFSALLPDAPSPIQSLAEYFTNMPLNQPTGSYPAEAVQLVRRMESLRERIVSYEAIGFTEFFRNIFYWEDDIRGYLQDIIAQKTALNDLTLSVKSIGASYGKEAYSIAALIQAELEYYASSVLFADDDARDTLALQWVDSWDISIYAFEKDYQKLAAIQQGVYTVQGSDMDHTDYHVLIRNMPGYMNILFEDFAPIAQPYFSNKRGFTGLITQRLKQWVVPVPVDLSTPEGQDRIRQYPAEIVFAMNVLPYFNPATTPHSVSPVTPDTPGVQEILAAIHESFNPRYKSFFMHDLDGHRAVDHELLGSQQFALPPQRFPSAQTIHTTALHTGIAYADDLRKAMGVAAAHEYLFDAYFNLRTHTQTLLETFAADPALDIDFENTEGQQRFITSILTDFIRPYTMDLILQNTGSAEISAQLALLPGLLAAQYRAILTERGSENTTELTDDFQTRLQTFMRSVHFTHGHLFIGTPFESDTVYEHRFVDYQLFHPDESQQGEPVVITEFISEGQHRQLSESLDDIPHIIKILDRLEFDTEFNFAAFELRLAGNLNVAETLLGGQRLSPAQLLAIKTSLATASIDFFTALAQEHASLLTQQYGEATVATLAQYIFSYLNTAQIDGQLKTAVESFTNHLYREQFYGTANTTASETYFFRDEDLFAVVESHIEDLILTKIARGDYHFTLRSLGASTGQEAVTLAVITDSVLQRFAQQLYDTELDRQKWIARWDYTIHAVDISLPRFLPLMQGTYSLDSLHDISVFHDSPALYDALFAYRSHSLEELNELYDDLYTLYSAAPGMDPKLPYQSAVKTVVSPQLRNRIRAVYGDLNNNPALLNRTQSNLTVALNLLALFGLQPDNTAQQAAAAQNSFIAQAQETTHTAYKGFIAFNTNADAQAEQLNQVPNQPYTLAPAATPSLADIQRIAHIMEQLGRTPTPAAINALLGLNDNQSAPVTAFFTLDTHARQFAASIPVLDSQQAQQQAIAESLTPFTINYIAELLPHGISADELSDHLAFFTRLLTNAFSQTAAQQFPANADTLAESFTNRVTAFMNSIEYSDGHLFIRTEFEGTPLFEHKYIDMQLFHPDPALRNTPLLVTEFVTQEKRQEILDRLADAEQVKDIFDLLDFDANFSLDRFSTDSYYAPAELPSALSLDDSITPQQTAAIKQGLATISTQFFRGLAEKYADQLTAFAGIADLQSLNAYLQALNTRQVRNDALLRDIMTFQDTLYQDQYYYMELSSSTGAGTMFLDLPPLRPNLENYLRDLVIQKMARDDFSFSLRSLGTSSGRETLVLLAITEQVLHGIASTLYDNPLDREKWIARWNYTVYANDIAPVRMLPLITGNYSIDNTDEVRAFLDNPDFYQSLFSYRSHSASDLAQIQQAFTHAQETRVHNLLPLDFTMPRIQLVASPRLRNRVTFYSGSIENNPQLYEATQGNATVLMNTLLYLSQDFPNITLEEAERQISIVEQLDANTDPAFKSFFMVNNDQPNPVDMDFFPDQPYVKPPLAVPSLDIIHRTAEILEQLDGAVTAKTLAKTIGLTPENAHIAQTYLAFRSDIQTLFTDQTAVSAETLNTDFIHSTLKDFAVRFIMSSLMNDIPSSEIESYLALLPSLARTLFISTAQQLDVPFSIFTANTVAESVQHMTESLEIHTHDLFIPATIAGRPAYTHYFIEQNPTHPDPAMNTPHIVSALIPASAKERLIQDSADIEYVQTIFAEITEQEIDTASAQFFLDYLRGISIQFDQTILSETEKTGLEGLTDFVITYHNEITEPAQQSDTPLIAELKQMTLNTSQGRLPWQTDDDYVSVPMETYFFRHQTHWASYIQTVKNTVSDLIVQQIAADDYSLKLESIGASTGKEAYSLAAITEQALRDYAENMYRDNPEKETLVEQWIDSWDIQILAADKSINRLSIAQQGVYPIVSGDELRLFINDFPDMLSYSSAVLTEYTNRLFKKEIEDFGYDQTPAEITVVVSNRLKRWVRPAYSDILSNPELLEQSDAHITLYMNTHPHLEKLDESRAQHILDILAQRSNPTSKRLVIMNDAFDVPPIPLNELPGHPYIKPPADYPTAAQINAVAVTAGIFAEQQLADIFGISIEELRIILDDALAEIIPGTLVDKLRWNREYTDSML